MKLEQANILYVDDCENNLLRIQQLLSKQYHLVMARSAEEGFEKLAAMDIHVIVADARLPGITGIEFLGRVRREYPSAFRMIVNSNEDVNAIIQSINQGHVYHSFTNPLDVAELEQKISHALELLTLNKQNKQLLQDLKESNQQLQRKTEQLEEEIENNIKIQQRFCGLLETAPDAMVIVDESCNIVIVNQQSEKIFGYSRQQLVGNQIAKLIPPPNEPGKQCLLETVFANKQWKTQRSPMEFIGMREDGQKFPIEISLSPMVAIDGVLISVAIRDITERKDIENQIRHLNEDLEMRVKKRTEELEAAKEAADQANHAKSAFLATMSHEIRTPMNGVIGLIDVFQQSQLTPDQQRLLTTMRDSGISLLKIIDDILDFSKVEAGKMSVEEIPTSVTDIIESVAAVLAPNATKNRLLLRIFIDPQIPEWLMSDPVKLRQVILNLGSNAIKFTQNINDKTGRISIQAHMCEQQENQVMVRFVVQDNGIGMSEDSVANLFKPFTQAESSTTRRFGGTGLGLSISARLIELMGGEITVVSEIKKGSTFSLVLPLAKIINSADIKPDNSDQENIKRILSHQRIAILVHNDENRNIIQKYLQDRVSKLDVLHSVDVLTNSAAEFDTIVLDNANDLDKLNAKKINSEEQAPCRTVLLNNKNGHAAELTDVNCAIIQSNPLYPSALLKAVTTDPTKDATLKAQQSSTPTVDKQDFNPETATNAPTISDAEASDRLILLAEDNIINQDIIVRQLNLLGYAAVVAANGKQALQYLDEKRYALLLTDCHMPKMDGFQLTNAIRASESNSDKHLPILAITANALSGYAERCIDAGMDDYISKPVRLQELKEVLTKWLPLPEVASQETDTPASDLAQLNEENPANEPTKALSEDDTPCPIDPTALVKLVGDNQQTHHTLLKKFLESANTTIDEFHSAYESQSIDTIKSLAHKLKSSARAVGAEKLADLCVSLEEAGTSKAWQKIHILRPQLDESMLHVKNYIEKL